MEKEPLAVSISLPRYLCDLNIGVILMTYLCCFPLHYVRGWAEAVRTLGEITRRLALGNWSCSMPSPKKVQTNQTKSAKPYLVLSIGPLECGSEGHYNLEQNSSEVAGGESAYYLFTI